MSALEQSLLSRAEARSLTDEVKRDAERLWRKLVELYEGGAHEVLGYSSWGAYFKEEFGGSDATAYRLLQSGRAMDQLPMGSSRPKTERVARELTPLLKQPAKLQEAWAEVVEETPEPTARQVREVVQRHIEKHTTEIPSVVRAMRELYATVQATPIEEVIAWEGNARQLAAQWASTQSYITDLFAARGVAIPEVMKGELDG